MVDKQEKEQEPRSWDEESASEDWWNRPDPEPKEKPTEEDLIHRIEAMKRASDAIPARYIMKQTLAIALILVNGLILYLGLGTSYQTVAFTYSAFVILLLLDYMIVVKKLRSIARGEKR